MYNKCTYLQICHNHSTAKKPLLIRIVDGQTLLKTKCDFFFLIRVVETGEQVDVNYMSPVFTSHSANSNWQTSWSTDQ